MSDKTLNVIYTLAAPTEVSEKEVVIRAKDTTPAHLNSLTDRLDNHEIDSVWIVGMGAATGWRIETCRPVKFTTAMPGLEGSPEAENAKGRINSTASGNVTKLRKGLDLISNPVTTRAGLPVKIISTEMRDPDYVVAGYIGNSTELSTWTREGKYDADVEFDSECSLDLVHAPITGEVWVNVWDYTLSTVHGSLREAVGCSKDADSDLLARIRIPFSAMPGRFDDER